MNEKNENIKKPPSNSNINMESSSNSSSASQTPFHSAQSSPSLPSPITNNPYFSVADISSKDTEKIDSPNMYESSSLSTSTNLVDHDVKGNNDSGDRNSSNVVANNSADNIPALDSNKDRSLIQDQTVSSNTIATPTLPRPPKRSLARFETIVPETASESDQTSSPVSPELRKYFIKKTFHPKAHIPTNDSSQLDYFPTTNIIQSSPDSTSQPTKDSDTMSVSPQNNEMNKNYFEADFDDQEPNGPEFEIRRTLSLKSNLQVKPKSGKKVVRFADSLGLDLEVVRMYPDMDQPPPMDSLTHDAIKALETSPKTIESILSPTPPSTPPSIKQVNSPSLQPTLPISLDNVQSTPTTLHQAKIPANTGLKHHRSNKHHSKLDSNMSLLYSTALPFFPFGDYIYQGMHSPINPGQTNTYPTVGSNLYHSKNLFFSPYDHLAFPTRHISSPFKIGNAMSGKYLSPTFPQPGKAFNFLKRVKDQKVCLEEVMGESEKCAISGLIRVENLSFHKTVYVRYTVDDWITRFDHLCNYVPNSTSVSPLYSKASKDIIGMQNLELNYDETICTDKFSFTIVVPFSMTPGSNLYLSVLYRTKGKDYWDNNSGHNYQLKCYSSPTATSTSNDLQNMPDENRLNQDNDAYLNDMC
ncbi:unnamed protein product [Gordionus sp. m RMFG-2023]